MIRAVFTSILLVASSANVLSANDDRAIDSLESVLASTSDDSTRADVLNELAEQLGVEEEEWDRARKYAKRAAGIARRKKMPRAEAQAYRHLGNAYSWRGNPSEALNYYFKELAIRERLPDSAELALSYRNVGALYYLQEQFDKALDYFVRSLETAQSVGNNDVSADALINLGLIYDEWDNGEKALKYLRAGLELKESVGDARGVALALNNIGNVLLKKNRLEDALVAYQKGIIAAKASADDRDQAISFLNLSKVLLRLGDANTAIAYANEASDIGGVYPKVLSQSYAYLSLAYELKNDAESALQYLKKKNALDDSLRVYESAGKLEELEIRYQTEKKEKEIAVLNAENRVKSLEITKKNEIRNYLLIGLFIILVSSGLLMFSYQINRRNHKLLVEKSGYINASLKEKEVLLKEIHHRVKNNLQLVSSMLNIQSRYITDTQTLKMIKDSQDRIKAMSIIHQELYEQDNLGQIKMRSYIEKLMDGLITSYSYDRENYTIEQDVADIKLDIDTAIPIGLILNELITNSFKYAFEGRRSGKILLTLCVSGDELILKVKDDGIGLKQHIDIRNTKSYGMKLISSLARKLKADVTFESENGTLVSLLIRKFRMA